MSTPRKRFTKEFKLEAIKMASHGGMSKAEVGRRLGISQNLIGYWAKTLLADGEASFPGKGRLKPADDELRRLRQQVKDLEQERDFLKKTQHTLRASRGEICCYR